MGNCLENLQLAGAVCRIGLYTMYKRLFCISEPIQRPEFAPVCIGFSDAGKSTILTLLSNESLQDIVPTSGFKIKALQFKKCILNVKEIGGSEKVRPFWHHYFKDAEGIIFVVNCASSSESFEEVKKTLHSSLQNKHLIGLPLLVIGTHQDVQEACSQQEMVDLLDLNEVCQGRQWFVCTGSYKDTSKIKESFEEFNEFLLKNLTKQGVQSENRI